MYDPESKYLLIDGLTIFAVIMALFAVARLIAIFLI